ncbi:MAG: holo-ACP synthase [Phycisphaeraceae bacterium]|nr:holo-ACP synthase [Phycisphaeraceae bacterium]
MGIVGHGIDLIGVERVAALVERHGERFRRRCFTDEEWGFAMEHRDWAPHLAARFAAKEAIFKALGTGWSGGIRWTDAGVVRLPSGRPTVRLEGVALEVARSLGITTWFLSLSHSDGMAIASAIAVNESPGT